MAQVRAGVARGSGARRQALVGVVGRCAEAGRRLDAEAAALDQVRGLEGPGAGAALDVAEGRFRALAARTVAAHATLTALRERYAPSATDPVTGSVEQAKDRLLFATAHLNATRRSIDAADGDGTARNLRAAEGAVAQAEILVTGVERLAARLREAAALVPAALTGAEAELTAARHGRSRTSLATGELNARLAHADGVLAAVREELTGSLPYDPLDALRRITRAVERLDVGRSGVLDTAALLVARTSLDSADDFVTVHRGAVGPRPAPCCRRRPGRRPPAPVPPSRPTPPPVRPAASPNAMSAPTAPLPRHHHDRPPRRGARRHPPRRRPGRRTPGHVRGAGDARAKTYAGAWIAQGGGASWLRVGRGAAPLRPTEAGGWVGG